MSDLRPAVEDRSSRDPLRWITTGAKHGPESDDGFAFAAAFAIQGRRREVVAEFGLEHRARSRVSARGA